MRSILQETRRHFYAKNPRVTWILKIVAETTAHSLEHHTFELQKITSDAVRMDQDQNIDPRFSSSCYLNMGCQNSISAQAKPANQGGIQVRCDCSLVVAVFPGVLGGNESD